jgi:hypothetical protein
MRRAKERKRYEGSESEKEELRIMSWVQRYVRRMN